MGISGDVEVKRRTLKILVFGIHPAEFARVGGWFRFRKWWMIPFPVRDTLDERRGREIHPHG
jgi:hypothetical protein